MYESLKEFKADNPELYKDAQHRGVIEDLCIEMGWEYIPPKRYNYWTYERCLESAKKYNYKKKWVKYESGAVNSATKNGWYEECTKHMISRKTKPTKVECIQNAKKYSGRWEWQKSGDSRYYYAAKKNGWLEECCNHMPKRKEWTKEECLTYAKQYDYASDWERSHKASYSSARSNGWYEECTKHMGRKIKPIGYWNDKGRCKEAISKCKSRKEVKNKYPSVHSSIRRNGWYNELMSHLPNHRNKWNLKTLTEEANKYETKQEFYKLSNGAYQMAHRMSIYDEVTKNLKDD